LIRDRFEDRSKNVIIMPEPSKIKRHDSLNHRLESWSQQQLTGCITIRFKDELSWHLYFFMGRLVWVTGGRYPYRRWQRLVRHHCPEWFEKLKQSKNPDDYFQAGHEYKLLVSWLNRHKVTGDQAANLTRGLVSEILFDILQCEETYSVSFEETSEHSLNTLVTVLNPEQVIYQAAHTWKKWKDAGLAQLSPDLIPVIRQPDVLQASLSPSVYQMLSQVINGQQPLRDISLVLKQDLVILVRTLAPYLRAKQIELIRVADLTPPAPTHVEVTEVPIPQSSSSPSALVPLIIGIDDSYLEKQILERQIKSLGCQFIGIEDPVQALPLLLEHQPALIFLDLVMPIANGYEICAQIRKISKLKDTPVIILTGNDGIVDRVRAKLVGATDFLGKPVDQQQVEMVLQRYIPSLKFQRSSVQTTAESLFPSM
jgi:two-component system, chemotaxis family, response regulator PixG